MRLLPTTIIFLASALLFVSCNSKFEIVNDFDKLTDVNHDLEQTLIDLGWQKSDEDNLEELHYHKCLDGICCKAFAYRSPIQNGQSEVKIHGYSNPIWHHPDIIECCEVYPGGFDQVYLKELFNQLKKVQYTKHLISDSRSIFLSEKNDPNGGALYISKIDSFGVDISEVSLGLRNDTSDGKKELDFSWEFPAKIN